MNLKKRLLLASLGCMTWSAVSWSQGTPLNYLDEMDPYYVSRTFPKLTTPQWLGEEGVDAVIILSIDDMREPEKYEAYLRPILNRLKTVTGTGAPLTIFTNTIEPNHAGLQSFLKEGLSIDVHTTQHPCPLLAKNDFKRAQDNVHECVDLLHAIPGNFPVAFRMPCCDSQNTPSPRFYAEIFNQTSDKGKFLEIDSSVFCVLTPNDPEVPKSISLDDSGEPRFRKYLPFPSFVNTIDDYPYPYVLGQLGWEIPCSVPSDWEAQNINGVNSPRSVQDMKAAIDGVVAKKGVYTLVFHPHGWIENTQVVEMIDHAVATHGPRIKFMSMRDVADRLKSNLMLGEGLRNETGRDNGVRLIDLNHDGYLDVIIANDHIQVTRIWNESKQVWDDQRTPFKLVTEGHDAGFRFADNVDGSGDVLAFQSTEDHRSAYTFDGLRWKKARKFVNINQLNEALLLTQLAGNDNGLRFHDIDGDGRSEIVLANSTQRNVYSWDKGWQEWTGSMPMNAQFVNDAGQDHGLRLTDLDGDGDKDLVYSNESQYGVFLFDSMQNGWATTIDSGIAATPNALPMITRNGTNNGAWFHSDHLWVQNEDTASLADLVERRSYSQLLSKP